MSVRYGIALIPEPGFTARVYRARQLICGHSPGRPNAPGVRAGSGFALVRAGMKHAQRYPQRLAAVELLPVQGD